MAKKSRKDYKYFTMNVPNELRFLFEAYIERNRSLGFKTVSQYLLHLLQKKAEEILKEYPELNEIKKDSENENKNE